MANAFFSIFEVTGRHDTAGVWLKDLLINSDPIWLMDESMEASAPDGIMVGMRLFDAGSFYAGFGIVVPVDAELVHLDCHGMGCNAGRWGLHRGRPDSQCGEGIEDGVPAPTVLGAG
jgi:hypothetical protein